MPQDDGAFEYNDNAGHMPVDFGRPVRLTIYREPFYRPRIFTITIPLIITNDIKPKNYTKIKPNKLCDICCEKNAMLNLNVDIFYVRNV